jgi:predicted amidophosphoribosyltransferase
VVVPVPVHAHRERQRGYDQAALIAAVAATQLGLPLARALERGRATVAQFELGRDQRAANVAGAFRPRSRDPAAARQVAGRWVLLVDDVVTTGATLAACGEALERMGAIAVSAVAVARER